MFAISNIHIVHVSVNIPQMQMFCCKSFLERFEDVHIYFIVARLKIEPLTVVTSQLTDGPTRRRLKSSRDVSELVVNPIQLIRS